MPPVKNNPKRPQSQIDEAVKRFLAGESAVTLAKYYKISKPGFYLWVSKYKREMLAKANQSGMTPKDAATADKRVLMIELEQLKLENHRLRDKVVALMIKAGDI